MEFSCVPRSMVAGLLLVSLAILAAPASGGPFPTLTGVSSTELGVSSVSIQPGVTGNLGKAKVGTTVSFTGALQAGDSRIVRLCIQVAGKGSCKTIEVDKKKPQGPIQLGDLQQGFTLTTKGTIFVVITANLESGGAVQYISRITVTENDATAGALAGGAIATAECNARFAEIDRKKVEKPKQRREKFRQKLIELNNNINPVIQQINREFNAKKAELQELTTVKLGRPPVDPIQKLEKEQKLQNELKELQKSLNTQVSLKQSRIRDLNREESAEAAKDNAELRKSEAEAVKKCGPRRR